MPKRINRLKKIEEGLQTRLATFDRAAADEENRTIPLTFSSATRKVERWHGIEVLDHSKGSIRMERAKQGLPLLINHDADRHMGIVEGISIGGDSKGRGVARFGKGQQAEEIFQDVLDGIRKGVSVGYRVHKMVLDEEKKDAADIYRVVDWEPYEVSLTPVPADTSVGIKRSIEIEIEREATIMECKHCKRTLQENEECK